MAMPITLMGFPIIFNDKPTPFKGNKIYLINLDEFLKRQLWENLVSDRLIVKFEGGKFAIYREGRAKPVGFIQPVE